MDIHVVMTPAPGSLHAAHVGERLRVRVDAPKAFEVFLRTDLRVRTQEVEDPSAPSWIKSAPWRDIPLKKSPDGSWSIDLPLVAVGWFRFKTYAIDEQGLQFWPHGSDAALSVHPASCADANAIYCAFVRMFGATKHLASSRNELLEDQAKAFDKHGWTVIPPSGNLRDLTKEVPHILGTLGFKILHLLPIHPTPTTHARYGRFGSPYAATDFFSIDPALIEHDKKTTSFDQFSELVNAVHQHGGRLFLDMAANHTGWDSKILNTHPEWFRQKHGSFQSPGAWGTTWEDLVEFDHRTPALWDHLSEVFRFWCQQGVDGFRCDAGYMLPPQAWQRIVRQVRKDFPDTVFLLEGLGGAWSATEALLGTGGMQSAYSELFQNYSGDEVRSYLAHAQAASGRSGLLINYAETHDNTRLAARGRRWTLLRTRLCSLTSQRAGWGITAGVEWLADEKVVVHGSSGMRWGAQENLVREIRRINDLLLEHPCFGPDSILKEVPQPSSHVYMLERSIGKQSVLVVANLGNEPQELRLEGLHQRLDCDLLGQATEGMPLIPPQTVWCLGNAPWSPEGHGTRQRRQKMQAAWAWRQLAHVLPLESLSFVPDERLANLVEQDPEAFVAALPRIDVELAARNLSEAIDAALAKSAWPQVVSWRPEDVRKITVVPDSHRLLIRHDRPFRCRMDHGGHSEWLEGVPGGGGWIACIAPKTQGKGILELRSHHTSGAVIKAQILFAGPEETPGNEKKASNVLITNGRGAYCRMAVDFGAISSKYDAVLAANPHPTVPCDRHILVKRIRAWVQVRGFSLPLCRESLEQFGQEDGTAIWRFRAGAGGGRSIGISCCVSMPQGRNSVILNWRSGDGKLKPRLILRVDMEDRGFHTETSLDDGLLASFRSRLSSDHNGFTFQSSIGPCAVHLTGGKFHPGEESLKGIVHPLEQTRGMKGSGDAWSPGWFSAELGESGPVELTIDAESVAQDVCQFWDLPDNAVCVRRTLPSILHSGVDAFLVRRGDGISVIAGYPWFLDWGRDTLIAGRGLIADGRFAEVASILSVFGAFEEGGTLPNMINGTDASNRDSVDAPLWYGILASEYAAATNIDVSVLRTQGSGRSVLSVLVSIANGYLAGTPNGIRVDGQSGLVWSPPHFTWMDTNFPACTPRSGYPIEIQALWIRLLELLAARKDVERASDYAQVAQLARTSLDTLFWRTNQDWPADCLVAPSGTPAAQATFDDAFRSNAVLAVALGAMSQNRARRIMLAAKQHLVVPAGLRSLAPLPIATPLIVKDAAGRQIFDPHRPYQGRYEGDEDSSRKPAYHNGTAWCWTFPHFAEGLLRAWPGDPTALAAARSYLGTLRFMIDENCIGQLPEILDGDAPHTERGCDAQAWSITEALRVSKLLEKR